MIIEFDMDQEIVPVKKIKKEKKTQSEERDRLDLPLQEHEWVVPKTK
jgi:hypothetical protein